MSDYGTVTYHGPVETVSGDGAQLYAWANRPGYRWPCSELARCDLVNATFARDSGDLVGLLVMRDGRYDDMPDLLADELSAWADDVRADEDEGGITLEGQSLGHRYVMGNVNAYCPKCSEEHGICVLDCDYDLDK